MRTGKESKINTREKLQEEKQKNNSLNQLQEMAIFGSRRRMEEELQRSRSQRKRKKKKLRSQKVKCETQKKN